MLHKNQHSAAKYANAPARPPAPTKPLISLFTTEITEDTEKEWIHKRQTSAYLREASKPFHFLSCVLSPAFARRSIPSIDRIIPNSRCDPQSPPVVMDNSRPQFPAVSSQLSATYYWLPCRQPTTVTCEPPTSFYCDLRASIGSTLAARRAGT